MVDRGETPADDVGPVWISTIITGVSHSVKSSALLHVGAHFNLMESYSMSSPAEISTAAAHCMGFGVA